MTMVLLWSWLVMSRNHRNETDIPPRKNPDQNRSTHTDCSMGLLQTLSFCKYILYDHRMYHQAMVFQPCLDSGQS